MGPFRGGPPVGHSPITPAFGACIEGVDLAHVTTNQFRQLYQLWQQHHVLVLRGQQLSHAQFHRFATMLGECEPGDAADEMPTEWHTDVPYAERPPFASLLWAQEAPATGGEMWFACMPAALRLMPAELVARLSWLPIQHGTVVHPIVIMQPETGESTLYLGRRRDACIPGLPLAESERLLNIVWSYATTPSVTLCHRWHAGDVVLWNNLTTMHRSDPLPPSLQRRFERARIKGRYTLSAPIQKEAA